MKMNNTKRVIKALNKLEYAIVTRNRLSKFMQKYNFSWIYYCGNEADNYTRLKYFNGETLITIYAREHRNNTYELLYIESIENKNDIKQEIIDEIKDRCLNQDFSIIGYEVNNEIMDLGGSDIFDDINYLDLLSVDNNNGYGAMVHCVPYKWFDWDIYDRQWVEVNCSLDIFVEYKIDKDSLEKIKSINNNDDIYYENVDWEKEFCNGKLRVTNIQEL